MNAPDTTALPVFVSLDDVHPSPTNPRRRFSAEAHAELVASVRQHGVLQPVLLRPWPKSGDIPPGMTVGETLSAMEAGRCWELVSGARRWRAAKAAGIDRILAVERQLSDVEVLSIQVVENLQREDVHPIEEAEGFERLMKAGELDAQAVADKVGKSKAYVYARLKLLDLCQRARDAFFEGKLNASTALLVARIPHADLQMQAMVELTKTDYRGELMSYRDAKAHIQHNYQLLLADATWPLGDAKLLPEAGSCSKCPKRSGNQTVLFEDEAADLCLDPKCYAAKRDAIYIKRKAIAESLQQKIIEGEEAKKLMPYGAGTLRRDADMVALDSICPADEDRRTYREILGKDAPVTAIIEDHRRHVLVECAEQTAIAAALQKAGINTETKSAADAAAEEREAKSEAERAARAEKIAIAEAFRGQLLGKVRAAVEANPVMPGNVDGWVVAEIACAMLERSNSDGIDILTRHGFTPDPDIEGYDQLEAMHDHIRGLRICDLSRLLVDLVIDMDDEPRIYNIDAGYNPTRLIAFARHYGIDVEGTRATVESALKKAAKTAKTAAKKAASAPAKTTSTPVGAARADDLGATPAAPAGGDGDPVKPGKKAKAKTNPAPASPSNEPAPPAGAEASSEAPSTAPKKRKSKTDPAPASPSNETPSADVPTEATLSGSDLAKVGARVSIRADATWRDGTPVDPVGRDGEIIVVRDQDYTVEVKDSDGFRCRYDLTRDQFTVMVQAWPFPVSKS